MKSIIRLLRRDRYSLFLNVMGLALGMSCFACLNLIVRTEYAFDKFHKNHNELYRLTTYFQRGDQEVKWAITNGSWVSILKDKISGVKNATKLQSIQSELTFQVEEDFHHIKEGNGFYVDSNLFELFAFKAIHGDPMKMLIEPNSIVVTRSFADRLFKDQNVLGKTILSKESGGDIGLRVNGVLEDLPSNSHLQFDFVISGNTHQDYWSRLGRSESGYPVHVYFEKYSNANVEAIETMISNEAQESFPPIMEFPIQKVTDIHFQANNQFEHSRGGNLSFIQILEILGYFIIIVAGINFIILNSSQLLKRHKEMAIRKVLGASKSSISLTLLLESMAITLISALTSILLIEWVFQTVLPVWFDLRISLFDHFSGVMLVFYTALALGIVSGMIPALNISNLGVINALKGAIVKNKTKFDLSSSLVVLQFAFTIIMIVGSVVVLKQLSYLKSKDLGYSTEAVINIPRSSSVDIANWKVFIKSLHGESQIESSSTTLYEFISDYNAHSVRVVNELDTTSVRVQWNGTDEALIETMNLRLLEGRNFNSLLASDSTAIILNRSAADALGIENLIDRTAFAGIFRGKPGRIIGIVENFHFQSFDRKVHPVAFFMHKTDGWKRNLLVKFRSSNYDQLKEALDSKWKEAGIITPLQYTFVDDWFEKMIESESNLSLMIISFSSISIFIACLGLIGLIRFNMVHQRKTISLHKVFGANISSILVLINRSYLMRILISFLIAAPFAYIGISKWLDEFAYRTDISFLDYTIGFPTVIIITGLVITIQSWRTAHVNPADVLRDE